MQNPWLSFKDSTVHLVVITQNLFDAALLFYERANLVTQLGTKVYVNQEKPSSQIAGDLISELRIIDKKISDLEDEMDPLFVRQEETDPLDWI